MFALEHRGFTMQKKKQEVDYHMTHPNPLAESLRKPQLKLTCVDVSRSGKSRPALGHLCGFVNKKKNEERKKCCLLLIQKMSDKQNRDNNLTFFNKL